MCVYKLTVAGVWWGLLWSDLCFLVHDHFGNRHVWVLLLGLLYGLSQSLGGGGQTGKRVSRVTIQTDLRMIETESLHSGDADFICKDIQSRQIRAANKHPQPRVYIFLFFPNELNKPHRATHTEDKVINIPLNKHRLGLHHISQMWNRCVTITIRFIPS